MPPCERSTALTPGILLLFGSALWAAAPVEVNETRCVALDLYLQAGQVESLQAKEVLDDILKVRRGVLVTVHDLDGSNAENARQRLQTIANAFRFEPKPPVIYGCGRALHGITDKSRLQAALEQLLRIDVYVRAGCPRCDRAKLFLPHFAVGYPGLDVRVHDIVSDSTARTNLDRLVREHQQAAASVPVFHLCSQLVVGWDQETTTGRRLEQILEHWTYPCRLPPEKEFPAGKAPVSAAPRAMMQPIAAAGIRFEASSIAPQFASSAGSSEEESTADASPPGGDLPMPPLPSQIGTPPLPSAAGRTLPGDDTPPSETVEVPLFGQLNARQLGLPVFTIAVGLVDGFNPCAMWVLLFLLSILVNLRDRWRILAVAGTFVVISGLAYFAFMAAWLNVFRFVGLLRPVQVTLALTAVAVGSIHIKDYFAFKQGISLSIPESAKPGIYARIRRIVTAENLWGAVVGATVLAVLVNIIELLCTAGLPALYTEILTMQQLPWWKNYSYLALYNAAYMFDDALMVALVVTTLGRRKMQEQHGRVLKLISGAAIVLLGLIMLCKPEWLM